jgi:hypothetical protein
MILPAGQQRSALIGGREPMPRHPKIRFECAPHVDNGDLLSRIGRQIQNSPRRRVTLP